MKKYILYVLSALLVLFTSCDSYLDTETYNQIYTEDAFTSPSDVKAARNGLYYLLGTYRFVGKNVIAVGDFSSDISVADGSSGHFVRFNNYTIADSDAELEEIWYYGYRVVNNATKIINGIDALLTDESSSDTDKDLLYQYKAEAFGIRAFAYFHLVNVFGLPYGVDNNPHGGLVLMDKVAIEPEENVSRSSVEDTYSQILADIKSSIDTYMLTEEESNEFYFSKAAVYALSARVKLYMKDFDGAIADATESLKIKEPSELSDEDYLAMWSSLNISEEDIFTIAKTEDDNLSANSLNTLYGSYGGWFTEEFLADFEKTDARLALFQSGNLLVKFGGIPTSKATSNIPQFRVSEMKLIIAEAEAMNDQLINAQNALIYTAKRDSAITSVGDLPDTKDELLSFIAKERKRELFAEGHRYYDARRTGEKITVANGKFPDFDIQNFVFPIPSDEINSGFQCEQNEGWFDFLPQP